jgi:hypothetical protein
MGQTMASPGLFDHDRADWGFLVRQPRWPRAIGKATFGKATFGKATYGTPYSPSSSGWFGFMAKNNTRNVGA